MERKVSRLFRIYRDGDRSVPTESACRLLISLPSRLDRSVRFSQTASVVDFARDVLAIRPTVMLSTQMN